MAICIYEINNNPVEADIVFRLEDYRYSSVVDYAGEQGLLDGIVAFKCYS